MPYFAITVDDDRDCDDFIGHLFLMTMLMLMTMLLMMMMMMMMMMIMMMVMIAMTEIMMIYNGHLFQLKLPQVDILQSLSQPLSHLCVEQS